VIIIVFFVKDKGLNFEAAPYPQHSNPCTTLRERKYALSFLKAQNIPVEAVARLGLLKQKEHIFFLKR